ncbi:MAG: glycosyltransferase family 1 protein [bacterium]|nr:glycosyltransferase family 1 protein [bacterium]
MRIAMDGFEANAEGRVGSGVYGLNLLRQFQHSDHTFDILLPNQPKADLPNGNARFQYHVLRPRRFWTRFTLPKYLLTIKKKPDVFFSPTHYIPRWSPVPIVATIFDLSFLQPEFSSFFRKKDLLQLKEGTQYTVCHASHILTISQFSKDAIINTYGIPGENVTVTPLAVNDHFSAPMPHTRLGEAREQYRLPSKFVLFVGTLQPRKNVNGLLHAFHMFLLDHPDFSLIVVGKKGWIYDEIFATAKKLDLDRHVKFLDYVPDNDLPAIMRLASLFVLPSFYEGFGIPVLEAMASGVPVVASNVSSLPEVVGRAGVLVDPNDVSSMTRGMERALQSSSVFKTRGKLRIQQFSWEKTAQTTLNVLERVAHG